jgi:hypothetical protein
MDAEIKSKLNSGNACYRSVQNFLFSPLLPKPQILKHTELKAYILIE